MIIDPLAPPRFLTSVRAGLGGRRPVAPDRAAAVLLLALALLVLLPAGRPFRSLAHEGGPGVTIPTPQAEAGGTLEISGFNLGTDLVVELVLVAGGESIVIGEALCDGHGDFNATLALPADLPAGIHTLQVLDPSIPGQPAVMAAADLKINSSILNQPTTEAAAGTAGDGERPDANLSRPANGLLLLLVIVAFWLWFRRRQAAGS